MPKTKTESMVFSEISALESSSRSDDEPRPKCYSHGEHAEKLINELSSPLSHAHSKPTRLDIILTVLFDCFLALLAIIFFVFGALASHSNYRLVDEVSYADALLSAVQLGPTIFPMVFALIAVRLIKAVHRAVASRNKERDDAQVKTLQQLLDSRTIGDTVVTIAKLKTINTAGILLVLLWAFSPLGGQASLRVATEETLPWPSAANFSYIDYDTIYSMETGSEWWIENIDIVKAIYSTSLISSNTVGQSSQDAWDNLKVPALEQLAPLPQNQSQWIEIPSDADLKGDSNHNIYSSLVGIPVASNISSFADPTTAGTDAYNATYSIESMYMYLGCANLSRDDVPTGIDLRQGWSVAASANGFQIATDTGERGNFGDEGPTTQRHLYYQAFGASEDPAVQVPDLISTTCNLTSTYVELNVSCVESSCSATHIRPSQLKEMSELWSPLDYNSSVADSFFGDFVNATVPRQLKSSSATEWYLTNPAQPFGIDVKNSYANYSGIDSSDFSLRLTQLLNAYYLANIAPAAVAGDLITKDWVNDYRYDYTTIPGQTTTPLTIIRCHNQWLAVLLVASVIMMCCGFACAILAVRFPSTDDLDIRTAMKTKGFKAFRKKLVESLSDD